MRFALNIHHLVTRQLTGTRLQKLLQPGLRVLVGIDQCQALQLVGQPGDDPLASNVHARVQINGTDQRFEGVGQDRFAAVTAALELTGAQAQIFAELESTRQHRQRLALDQTGAQTRQLPLTGLRKMIEQRFTGNEVENGVAEKLQTLVVASGIATMGQGQEHQLLILELITEPALETG